MPMLAFHNDATLKARKLDQVRAHEAADEIVKGQYWEHGKGCAVGCTVHSGDHRAYETEMGIPVMLARLEDRIFEGMSNEAAKRFPARFITAAPVGADLSLVGWQFLSWLVEDVVERHGTGTVKDACADAIAVLRSKAAGENVSTADAETARRKARTAANAAAAAYAADAAAYAAAAAANAAAAAAAANAAAAAAYAAAATANAAAAAYAADAADADRRKAYDRQAEKMLELMAAAPVANA